MQNPVIKSSSSIGKKELNAIVYRWSVDALGSIKEVKISKPINKFYAMKKVLFCASLPASIDEFLNGRASYNIYFCDDYSASHVGNMAEFGLFVNWSKEHAPEFYSSTFCGYWKTWQEAYEGTIKWMEYLSTLIPMPCIAA